MPRARTAVAALLAATLLAPGPARADDDLPALEQRLAEATARAERLADDLEAARARDGGLRAALEDLAQTQDDARARLDAQVRRAYIAATATSPYATGLTRWTDPSAAVLVARGQGGGVRVQQQLVDAVAGRSEQVRRLRSDAEAFTQALRVQAAQVLAEQDRARALLARTRELAQQRAQQQAQQQAQQEQLDRAQAALDAVSARVTRALTPAQTERGRRAAADAEPVLQLLEQAGAGYPPGWRPTGELVVGTASWYGPGFVGSPTASGRPYDPERLSCAHRTLPLGTVLHVTSGGRSVNCLVDDRGPYVGDRVLDLSRAGSRALGYEGTAQVVAQVLAQTSSPSR